MAGHLKKLKFNWNFLLRLDKKMERFPKNVLLALIIFVATVAVLKNESQKIGLRTLGLQAQIDTEQETIYQWEQILAERPDYRDGWVQLAVVYYKSGNKEKAKEALQKAMAIDPNNEAILSLFRFIEGTAN